MNLRRSVAWLVVAVLLLVACQAQAAGASVLWGHVLGTDVWKQFGAWPTEDQCKAAQIALLDVLPAVADGEVISRHVTGSVVTQVIRLKDGTLDTARIAIHCFPDTVAPRSLKFAAGAEASDPERLLTVSMAVVMLADPDDDVNVSWYAHGIIDGLLKTGAYRCPKQPRANRGQITAEAKRLAKEFVLVGKGETPFGLLVIAALNTEAGCSPVPPLK